MRQGLSFSDLEDSTSQWTAYNFSFDFQTEEEIPVQCARKLESSTFKTRLGISPKGKKMKFPIPKHIDSRDGTNSTSGSRWRFPEKLAPITLRWTKTLYSTVKHLASARPTTLVRHKSCCLLLIKKARQTKKVAALDGFPSKSFWVRCQTWCNFGIFMNNHFPVCRSNPHSGIMARIQEWLKWTPPQMFIRSSTLDWILTEQDKQKRSLQ